MDFQAVARPPWYRAHQEKNRNFVTKVQYPGWHSVCVPTASKNFPDKPSLTGFLLQRNVMEHMFGFWFAFPFECEDLLYGPRLRWNCEWKKYASKCFQAVSVTQQRVCWESYLPLRKETHQQRVFLELLSCRNCLPSKTWDLQAWPEGLTSKARVVCLPVLSEPCKHIPRPHHDCPWGGRLREFVWKYWVTYCGHQV